MALRIGLVCPYAWDVPGGVQFHVRDLALVLQKWGHHVNVIAPAMDEDDLPSWVTSAGRPVPVRYNGAVARLAFGPLAATRVRRWIDEGNFDLLHIHEPPTPSVSVLACWLADGPMIGTFHMAVERSRTMNAVSPILEPALEKLSLRIAVSPMARETAFAHHGRDVVVLPNGVDTKFFAAAEAKVAWQGKSILFIGRFDEPRKGLSVLLQAMPAILDVHPTARLLVAGPGDQSDFEETMSAPVAAAVEFLGRVTEDEKAQLLKSAAIYVAPNTGGESFGIIIAEAMAAGAPVVASDLDAFVDVMQGAGAHFGNGDSDELAELLIRLLDSPEELTEMGMRGRTVAQRYDWETVAEELVTIYETVTLGRSPVVTGNESSLVNRLRRRSERR
jgi:phosphatidyl-myo-inositol alpha-mannosyltransferase